MRTLMLIAVCLLGFFTAMWLPAQQATDPYVLDNLLQRIPPLTHDVHGRLPLVTWEPFIQSAKDDNFQKGVPLPTDLYQALAKRGLAQAVRLNASFIPIALALQQAGVPVVVLEGNAGDVPGSLAPDALHQLPKDFKYNGTLHPCPLLLAGWHTQAMATRATLQQFKDAGVTLDAAWLDWENEPIWGQEEWEQSSHCERCRKLFPPGILDDYPTYRDFIVRFRQQLFSTYLAAPIREFYPRCSITNWAVVHSSPERLTLHYWGRFRFPPMDAGLFTATNPVAYGNDIIYQLQWSNAWKDPEHTPLDQAHMDRLYAFVMLSQISEDAANAAQWAPEKRSIPWVCRYCPDMEDAKVPMLSRPRYRELLRHLWLRGAESLQVFNAFRPDHPELRLEEVEDAVSSYDEALRYRAFLEKGEVMTTVVPDAEETGAVWSGLRMKDEAIVRAFTQGTKAARFSLVAWNGVPAVTLDAPPEGVYYHLYHEGAKIRVVPE